MKDVIIVTGPTAGGKTKLAHSIALSAGGEIIVADSMKVYRGADIGTSKPPEDYLKEVKYHLLGIIRPDERYDLGSFHKDSLNIIKSLHKRNKLPVVAGGTPLYITKLIEGLADIPSINEKTAEKLEGMDTAELYERLKKADPERAEAIHPNMRKRIIRAFGVYLDTGSKMSQLLSETRPPPYNFIVLYIDWPREKLYERSEKRVDRMFEAGLIEEVKLLLDKYSDKAPVFEGVGYSETVQYLRGVMTIKEASDEIKKKTRHYARKQLTWWRNRTFTRPAIRPAIRPVTHPATRHVTRPLIRLNGEKRI
jgi:tRNA dimethylallyltransferase